MLVASMVVKVDAAQAEELSRQFGRIPGLTTYGVHKDDNVVVVAEAQDEAQLENMARYILDHFEGAWGVFPTFVASDNDVDTSGRRELPVVS
jgi:nitrate reductase NapAB chaperone NapD